MATNRGGTGGVVYGPLPKPKSYPTRPVYTKPTTKKKKETKRPLYGPLPNPKKKKPANKPYKGKKTSGQKSSEKAVMPTRAPSSSAKATPTNYRPPGVASYAVRPVVQYGMPQNGVGSGGGSGGFGSGPGVTVPPPLPSYPVRPVYKPMPIAPTPSRTQQRFNGVADMLPNPIRRFGQAVETAAGKTARTIGAGVLGAGKAVENVMQGPMNPFSYLSPVLENAGIAPGSQNDITTQEVLNNYRDLGSGALQSIGTGMSGVLGSSLSPGAWIADQMVDRGVIDYQPDMTLGQFMANAGQPMNRVLQYHPAAIATRAAIDAGLIPQPEVDNLTPGTFYNNAIAAPGNVMQTINEKTGNIVPPTIYDVGNFAANQIVDDGLVSQGELDYALNRIPSVDYSLGAYPSGTAMNNVGNVGSSAQPQTHNKTGVLGANQNVPTALDAVNDAFSPNPVITPFETAGGNLSNTGGQATKANSGDATGTSTGTNATTSNTASDTTDTGLKSDAVRRGGGGRSRGRWYGGGGYSGRSYGGSGYSGGYSRTGGTSGGDPVTGDYERYGITPEWMTAYENFWGEPMPADMYGVFQAITDLFSRYVNRMPQTYDWQKMWEVMKQQDESAENMWTSILKYEPMLQEVFLRPPLFQPPGVSYTPDTSF